MSYTSDSMSVNLNIIFNYIIKLRNKVMIKKITMGLITIGAGMLLNSPLYATDDATSTTPPATTIPTISTTNDESPTTDVAPKVAEPAVKDLEANTPNQKYMKKPKVTADANKPKPTWLETLKGKLKDKEPEKSKETSSKK